MQRPQNRSQQFFPLKPIGAPMDEETQKPLYNTNFGRFLICWLSFATILGIIGLILGSIAIDQGGLKIISNYVADFTMALTPKTSNFAYAQCGNFSVTEDEREFTDDTLIGYKCPQPLDTCNEMICWADDGACHEQLKSNSTCSASFPCDAGETCNPSTCSCESDSTNQCVVDDDCMRIEDNDLCQAVTCVSGQCQRDTAFGMQCSTNGECAPSQYCNSLCQCTSAAPSLIPYTPTITTSNSGDAIDWENAGALRFRYTQFSNFVRVIFLISAPVNETANQPTIAAFTATLPPGLPGIPGQNVIGSAVFEPTVAIPGFGLEDIVIFGTASINNLDSSTELMISFNNQNPAFVAPLAGFNTLGTGWFEYEVLIV